MPLVQHKIGTSNHALVLSLNVVLTTPATAGNLLLAYISPDKSVTAVTAPSGFTLVPGSTHYTGPGVSRALFYKIAAGGEQTITCAYTSGTTRLLSAIVLEISGINGSNPIDVVKSVPGNTLPGTNPRTLAYDTSPTATAQANELAVAFWSNDSADDLGTVPVVSARGWTEGFAEVAQFGFNPTYAASKSEPALNVGTKTLTSTGTVSTVFSYTDGEDEERTGVLVTLRETAQTSTGAMSGSAAIAFAAGGTAGGTGRLSGSTALAFASSGTIRATGALAGSSAFAFGTGGSIGGLGGLAGSAALTFAAGGTAGGSGRLAGSSAITTAAGATAQAFGALAGSAAFAFTTGATLIGLQGPGGSTSLLFSAGGTLRGIGALAGSAAFALSAGGTATGIAPSSALAGGAALAFTAGGTLRATGAMSGSAAISFAAAGTAEGFVPAPPPPPPAPFLGLGAQVRLTGAARAAARGAGPPVAVGAVHHEPLLAIKDLRALALRLDRLERETARLRAETASWQ